MCPRQRICKVAGRTMIHLFPNSCIEAFLVLTHYIKSIPNEKLDAAVKNYEEKGMPLIRGGHYLEDIHLYIDSMDKLGFQLEIGNCADISLTEDMYYIFPRER